MHQGLQHPMQLCSTQGSDQEGCPVSAEACAACKGRIARCQSLSPPGELTASGMLQVLGVCNKEGEDARCHNSVCYLGLCTSVNDHLHYLGANMFNGEPSC